MFFPSTHPWTSHETLGEHLEAAEGAAAVIAVGACAHWGNIQASRPNPTGAVGVGEIVRDKPVVNIAGCPPIGAVVTGTIVHYLTFNRLPALDPLGPPRHGGDENGTGEYAGSGHPSRRPAAEDMLRHGKEERR